MMAGQYHPFPSGLVFLAILLLSLHVSPTAAFGAGNIGRTCHPSHGKITLPLTMTYSLDIQD